MVHPVLALHWHTDTGEQQDVSLLKHILQDWKFSLRVENLGKYKN